MIHTRRLMAAALLTVSNAAFAQAVIDQNRALAGNVTPGDTAGYPITISQPGSYKLTSNLYAPADAAGIVITVPGVTLDLNGFSLIGAGTCSRISETRQVLCTASNLSKSGIDTGPGATVRNGAVQGFSGPGIFANAGSTVLERLRVQQNAASGIHSGPNATSTRIVDTISELNGHHGADVVRAVVTGSQFQLNGMNGVQALITMVLDTSALHNFSIGLSGGSVGRTVAFGNGVNRSNVTPLGVGTNMDGFTVY
jgi:hypothetical protein